MDEGLQETAALKAARRSDHMAGKPDKAADSFHSSNEIDIFEEWIGAEATDRIVSAPPDENSGVAIA